MNFIKNFFDKHDYIYNFENIINDTRMQSTCVLISANESRFLNHEITALILSCLLVAILSTRVNRKYVSPPRLTKALKTTEVNEPCSTLTTLSLYDLFLFFTVV